MIIAAVRRDISRAHFWWNDRIYCIRQVRRSYVDSSELAWLEVDAWWSEGCGDRAEDDIVVTIPLAAVELHEALSAMPQPGMDG